MKIGRTNASTGGSTHSGLIGKNAEPNFLHVTQEEKTNFHTHNNKEYLDGYNPTLFATALQGEKADSALQSLPPNTVIDVDYSALKDKVNGIEENANNYQHPFFHPTYILEGVNPLVGTTDKYLNEKGEFTKPVNAHEGLEGKNNETDYQHVDTTITKETLIEADKVTIYDSVTGKVVLTDKSNVGGGSKTYSDVTHEELLNIINNNGLIPNSSYRITDYTTTTSQTDTQSVGNNFDIIVTALSTNKLSEVASCVRKAGDTYFANAKLEAWEIKYRIDNDTSRFAWADTVNGKGVIYYMKDEWNNECPYDFKNIQFKKSDVFLYTFGGTADDSLTGGCHHNTMMMYGYNSVLMLNFNTFGTGCYGNTFGTDCYSNTFGSNCNNNTFGTSCDSNQFSDNCYSNTFGYNCNSNTLGNGCNCNTFGDNCYSNTINGGNNTFGNNCNQNTFGTGCSSNTLGDYCEENTFGNYFQSNTFGIKCRLNTFGNYYKYNTFGNYFVRNNFYAGTSGTTKKDYIQYIVVEDGCMWNNFYSTLTTSSSSYLQRIRIKGLQNTSATNTQITLSTVNTKYEWLICYTSAGVLKQYCPNN